VALEQKKWRDVCLWESRRWTGGVLVEPSDVWCSMNFKWMCCYGMLLDLISFVSNAQTESVNRIELEIHSVKLRKQRFCEAEQTEMQKFSDTKIMLPRQQSYKVQRLQWHSDKVTTSLTTSKLCTNSLC